MHNHSQQDATRDQETVLLIEDNPAQARLIQHMLREGGENRYQLVHADRLASGYTHLSDHSVALILLDLSLPDSTGLDTFEQLQTHAARIPVIILTGSRDRELAPTALDRGAQDYLVKDEVTPGGLVKAVHYAIKRKQAEQQIRFQASLLNQVRNAVIATDDAQHINYWNRYAETLYGWSSAEAIGRPALELLLQQPDDELAEALRQAMNEHHAWEGGLELKRKDGSAFPGFMTLSPLRDANDSLSGFVSISVDITERKEAERQLEHSAFHDSLTGLPNRALFTERLNRALLRGSRRDWRYAVMLMDLDRFKRINDSLGHMAGDQLLAEFAQRVQSCLRPGDTLARLGGDEFTILLEDLSDSTDAIRVAERIHEQMAIPFAIAGEHIKSSTSIGIAFSDDYQNPGELLRDADIAMYQAKARGKGCHVIFERGMHAHAVSTLQRESELRQAVARGEFKLLYQPIIDLETDRCIAAEALLRWEHPTEGLLCPSQFLAMAEETGLIIDIGERVIEDACRQLQDWQHQFDLPADFGMHLNLSAKQFCHRGLVRQVSEALSAHELGTDALTLEVGEQVLLEHPVLAAVMLAELRELGVQISVNDFGSGFSSLRCLRHFPVDALKIDRSFIEALGQQSKTGAIIKAMVELADNLEVDLVAVGVEQPAHRSELQRLGCRQAQGRLFYPPLEPPSMGSCLAH